MVCLHPLHLFDLTFLLLLYPNLKSVLQFSLLQLRVPIAMFQPEKIRKYNKIYRCSNVSYTLSSTYRMRHVVAISRRRHAWTDTWKLNGCDKKGSHCLDIDMSPRRHIASSAACLLHATCVLCDISICEQIGKKRRQFCIPFINLVKFRETEEHQNSICVIGGLGVTCSPRDLKFAGSNPTKVDGFFQDVKILSTNPPGETLSWGSRVWDFRLVK